MSPGATRARAYWVVRPGAGELRAELLPPLAPGQSLVRARYSGVSAGTERLIGLGRVPASAAQAMACRGQAGALTLPVKYGYCLVGEAIEGALAGQRVFAMHPHQDQAVLDDAHALLLPPALPLPRATLIPNLETALNAVWDAELAPGEPVLVLGAGAVGLLVAYVAFRLAGTRATIADLDAARRLRAAGLPWVERVLEPRAIEPGAFAACFEATGNPAALQVALDGAGFEARVVVLSWYGDQPATLALGTGFHWQRKRILASQVASVARAKRATHGPGERLAEVLTLLDRPELDALLGPPVPFAHMPERMAELYRRGATDPAPLIAYP